MPDRDLAPSHTEACPVVAAVRSALTQYATFSGRASRAEFWWFILFDFLCVVIVVKVFPAGFLFFLLAAIIPTWAVWSRRMHDINRSGWIWLISFIPLAGSLVLLIFALTAGDPGANNYGKPHPLI